MNIKDYILSDDTEFSINEKKQTHKTEYTFSVVYENDTDFILDKTSVKTDKKLVVLVSQGQIYIKNEKNNEIENVTDVAQLSTFKRGMDTVPNFSKLTWTPFVHKWYGTPIVVSNSFETLIKHKEAVKILSNKKLNPLNDTSIIYRYERDPDSFKRENEFLKILRLFSPSINASSYGYDNMVDTLKETKIDYNTVKKLLPSIVELGVKNFETFLKSPYAGTILNDYKVDLKSFITYLTYTIKNRNGLEITTWNNHQAFNLNDYVDYLRMQTEMYGKVKEKYPEYWLSQHQMMVDKYNTWKKIQRIQIATINQDDLVKYEYENDIFKVVVPLTNADILDEAQQQQHCLASYLDRITNGATHIVFIRTKISPDESLLTVEITPNERIVQVRGFQNRQYTSLEYAFLKEWAKAKNLKLEVPSV